MKKYLSIKTIIHGIRVSVFYLFNWFKYKKLEFRALIINPLRINGKQYISLHRNARINSHSWIIALKNDQINPELIIKEGANIGDFNHIAAVRRVVIGKYVLTANRVYISDNLHAYDDISLPVMNQPVKFKAEVSIGDGSWIGENACIIGAKIGKHCVIGANAVVTTDIPDYCVAVGIPARVIKQYNMKTNSWEIV